MYNTSDFDYLLPESFIAQDPVSPRDSSKLFVYDSSSLSISHKQFHDVFDLLCAGDVLVVNSSKVIPARINFEVNGSFKEVFILSKVSDDRYHVLVKPGRFFKLGRVVALSDDVSVEVVDVLSDGSRIVRFFGDGLVGFLERFGSVPLPPYIKHSTSSFEDYQTVYASSDGSVAAPTAGLHFTIDLLSRLKAKGVEVLEVVLHVGRGTFLPVFAERIEDHVMHSEFFSIGNKTAERLNSAIVGGRRIIAVGTTSVRVLESAYTNGGFSSMSGETDIFIYPEKYNWKVVDGLITNFHLPKSSLLMLVSSFLENKGEKAPVERLLEFYDIAKSEKYRFYSFGDAMFIY